MSLADIKALAEVVGSALAAKQAGQYQKYVFLIQQFRGGSDLVLRRLFLALARNVSDIGRDPAAFDELTTAAISVRLQPLDVTDEAVASGLAAAAGAAPGAVCTFATAEAYASFLCSLVGASTVFLQSVFRALVRNLVLMAGGLEGGAPDGSGGAGAAPAPPGSSAAPMPWDSPILERFHALIYRTLALMLRLVPTGGATLYAVLAEHFPHKRMGAHLHASYTRHLLHAAVLLPSLQDRIVATLVDRMVDLDVDIPLEDLPDDEEEEAAEEAHAHAAAAAAAGNSGTAGVRISTAATAAAAAAAAASSAAGIGEDGDTRMEGGRRSRRGSFAGHRMTGEDSDSDNDSDASGGGGDDDDSYASSGYWSTTGGAGQGSGSGSADGQAAAAAAAAGAPAAGRQLSPEAAAASELANKLDEVFLLVLRYIHARGCGCTGRDESAMSSLASSTEGVALAAAAAAYGSGPNAPALGGAAGPQPLATPSAGAVPPGSAAVAGGLLTAGSAAKAPGPFMALPSLLSLPVTLGTPVAALLQGRGPLSAGGTPSAGAEDATPRPLLHHHHHGQPQHVPHDACPSPATTANELVVPAMSPEAARAHARLTQQRRLLELTGDMSYVRCRTWLAGDDGAECRTLMSVLDEVASGGGSGGGKGGADGASGSAAAGSGAGAGASSGGGKDSPPSSTASSPLSSPGRPGATGAAPSGASGAASSSALAVTAASLGASSSSSSSSLSFIPPVCRAEEGRCFRDRLFTLMLGVFERSVLLTRRSKFAQFLIFYACALDPAFVDRFTGRLLHIIRSADRPALVRAACAAYLGSFLARAAYVDDTTLRSALFYLMEFGHAYADLYDLHRAREVAASAAGTAVAPGAGIPAELLDLPPLPPVSVFYAVLQSAFYVVCFQAAALRSRAGGLDFLAQLGWGRLVSSPLDPLKHCLESVSREFVRVAHLLRLVSHADMAVSSVYARLTQDAEAEDAAEESGEGSGSGAIAAVGEAGADERNPLDSFFPFDPFLLRRSARYIAPLYRSWPACALGVADDLAHWTETEGYDTAGSRGGATSATEDEAGGSHKRSRRSRRDRGRRSRRGGDGSGRPSLDDDEGDRDSLLSEDGKARREGLPGIVAGRRRAGSNSSAPTSSAYTDDTGDDDDDDEDDDLVFGDSELDGVSTGDSDDDDEEDDDEHLRRALDGSSSDDDEALIRAAAAEAAAKAEGSYLSAVFGAGADGTGAAAAAARLLQRGGHSQLGLASLLDGASGRRGGREGGYGSGRGLSDEDSEDEDDEEDEDDDDAPGGASSSSAAAAAASVGLTVSERMRRSLGLGLDPAQAGAAAAAAASRGVSGLVGTGVTADRSFGLLGGSGLAGRPGSTFLYGADAAPNGASGAIGGLDAFMSSGAADADDELIQGLDIDIRGAPLTAGYYGYGGGEAAGATAAGPAEGGAASVASEASSGASASQGGAGTPDPATGAVSVSSVAAGSRSGTPARPSGAPLRRSATTGALPDAASRAAAASASRNAGASLPPSATRTKMRGLSFDESAYYAAAMATSASGLDLASLEAADGGNAAASAPAGMAVLPVPGPTAYDADGGASGATTAGAAGAASFLEGAAAAAAAAAGLPRGYGTDSDSDGSSDSDDDDSDADEARAMRALLPAVLARVEARGGNGGSAAAMAAAAAAAAAAASASSSLPSSRGSGSMGRNGSSGPGSRASSSRRPEASPPLPSSQQRLDEASLLDDAGGGGSSGVVATGAAGAALAAGLASAWLLGGASEAHHPTATPAGPAPLPHPVPSRRGSGSLPSAGAASSLNSASAVTPAGGSALSFAAMAAAATGLPPAGPAAAPSSAAAASGKAAKAARASSPMPGTKRPRSPSCADTEAARRRSEGSEATMLGGGEGAGGSGASSSKGPKAARRGESPAPDASSAARSSTTPTFDVLALLQQAKTSLAASKAAAAAAGTSSSTAKKPKRA